MRFEEAPGAANANIRVLTQLLYRKTAPRYAGNLTLNKSKKYENTNRSYHRLHDH